MININAPNPVGAFIYTEIKALFFDVCSKV